MRENKKGITLIALIVTIVILLILAGVAISQLTGENGLLTKATDTAKSTKKQTAVETINLKITAVQIDSYAENQTMPTLQYLVDKLCEDADIDYVLLESKAVASREKIVVGDNTSIFTKLKDYPYEFEINTFLQLASIDGVKVDNNPATGNSTLIEKPTITVNTIGTLSIKVNTDIGNSAENDIAAYVFFDADTKEIIKIIENSENLVVDGLIRNTNYNIYMKILDKYGYFTEASNTLTFTTKNFGKFNLTYAKGYSYNTYGTDVTSLVQEYLFDGILTKQGSYGAYLMVTENSSEMTFDVKDGDVYITFCSNYYSDGGGQSGKTVNFYKLNLDNEYDLYATVEQKNNNQAYSKTLFREGSYKVTFSANYVEFDEWIISED